MTDDVKNSQPVDDQVKIPRELAQFLKQETYSLLIKGQTGTGKTTLALSILKELDINNCLYISTRISPNQLFQYHPWIGNFFDQPKVTELTEIPQDGMNHHMFVDARLDEPGSLFERITNELMDVKAPTIVIDTWDAIGFLMDKEALMNNAKVLQTWRERAGAKLIFVAESSEDNTFDFLADGIVELRQRNYNERRIREIFLSKLRGVRINKPSYIFSINNGAFRSYEHYNPSEFLDLMRFLPKYINKEFIKNNHFSTGYHELDDILGGGFPIGSAISIELNPHVNAKIVLVFLSKIMSQFIASQNSILYQPFEKTDLEMITKYQKSLGLQKDMISVISTTVQPKRTKTNMERQIQQKILKIKKENQKKLLLSILGPETVNLISKMDPSASELALLPFIKSNSDLSIFVSRRLPDNRHTPISEISDIRLSIHEIDGTIFLQSDTPWSHLYAIVVQPERDNDGIWLEPIV
jgi:KaiC/GvpD/RAD55 family RecA-like ATPase